MASDVFTAAELIAVLTVYCILFCPLLCWAISAPLSLERPLDSHEEHSHA